jgi:ABC-type sugar transport system, permease component
MVEYKKSFLEKTYDAFNVLIITIFTLSCLYPFWYIVVASFSSPLEVAKQRGIMLLVKGFTLEAYKAVFANPNIWTGYANTAFYVIVGSVVNLFMTVLAAYGLSRKNVWGRGAIMKMIVFTMFFGGGLIPSFLMMKNFGLVDSRWALILPGAISTYNMIIMRTSFQGVPASLEESARIDGANDFTIMYKIIVPLSLPVMAVITLYYAVGHWNAFFGAVVYLRTKKLYPLQLILREVLISNSTDSMMTDASSADKAGLREIIKYATIIVSTIPILFLYPFLQKYFVKGVMIGSLKE